MSDLDSECLLQWVCNGIYDTLQAWELNAYIAQEFLSKAAIGIPMLLQFSQPSDRCSVFVPIFDGIITACVGMSDEGILLSTRTHYCLRPLVELPDFLV